MSQDTRVAPRTMNEKDFGALVQGIVDHRMANLANTPAGRTAIARVAKAYIAATKASKNPSALYNCDAASIYACMLQSAETGIFPSGVLPGCWLIPKGGQMQWWLSHRGIIELVRRAGYLVHAMTWHEGEEFAYVAGVDQTLRHVPNLDAPRTMETMKGAYCVVKTTAGVVVGIHVMTKAEILKRKAKAGSTDVWNAWPIEMSLKTVIKGAAARGVLPLDASGQSAMEADAEYIEAMSARVEQVTPPAKQIASGAAADEIDALLNQPEPERTHTDREPDGQTT